jgi:uncharacterized membrane protein
LTARTLARRVAVAGHLGLILVVAAWTVWLDPPQRVPRALVLVLLTLPLLLPLRGILHGRPYTHAWVLFVALGYFVLGVWHAAVPDERPYGLAIVALSLLWFFGAMFYVRFTFHRP